MLFKPWQEPDWQDLPILEATLASEERSLPRLAATVTWPTRRKLNASDQLVFNNAVSQAEKLSDITIKETPIGNTVTYVTTSGGKNRALYFSEGQWIAQSDYSSAKKLKAMEATYYQGSVSAFISGRKRIRKAQRIELLDLIREFGSGKDPVLIDYLSRARVVEAAAKSRAAKARARRRVRATDPYRCEAALRVGKRVAFEEAFQLLDADALGVLQTAPPEARIGRWEALEAFPRLDVRVLRGKGQLHPGAASKNTLRWDGVAGLEEVLVAADLPAEGHGLAKVKFRWRGQIYVQNIDMFVESIGLRARPWFLCPITGSKHEVLAFREGWFASPRAQRLIYRSQLRSNAAPV